MPITPCLLAAVDPVGLSARAAFRRQCHLDGVSPLDRESHSNNQLLSWEGYVSAHPATFARMVRSHFHWVDLEPSLCTLEQSDHTSRNCLKTISARSKPLLAMELSSEQDSGQTRFLQRCLSSPVLRPELGSTLEPGPKS